jgi:hypothetical protein
MIQWHESSLYFVLLAVLLQFPLVMGHPRAWALESLYLVLCAFLCTITKITDTCTI